MFAHELPPCFKSVGLIELLQIGFLKCSGKHRGYVEYFSSRDSNVPRTLAIPHPDSYAKLCGFLKKNWTEINIHIGKADRKNYVHVRKIDGERYIFDMSSNDNWEKIQFQMDYLAGCTHIVKTDISNFFPSIYSHSIPWALMGRKEAKSNKKLDKWQNKLDLLSRQIKNGESNGLLIGMHTSHILSEIILTKVDEELCKEKNHTNYVRHIDDYEFYATSEDNALEFIKDLASCLKKYDLNINQKKTDISPVSEHRLGAWTGAINSHRVFLTEKLRPLTFSEVQDFIDHALDLSQKNNSRAPLNYAIKSISRMQISTDVPSSYVRRILALAILYPYLYQILEGWVFIFGEINEIENILHSALPKMVKSALKQNQTDALAYSFYYAIKYQIKMNLDSKAMTEMLEEVKNMGDCISILLAWKYCVDIDDSDNACIFDEFALDLINDEKEYQDKYWIFLYEYSLHNKIDIDSEKQFFLSCLADQEFSFFKDAETWRPVKKPLATYGFTPFEDDLGMWKYIPAVKPNDL